MPKFVAASVSVRRDITRVNIRRLGPAQADANDVCTIPCIPGATDPAAQALKLPPATPIRVLVVDDHALFRIGLRQLLEQQGFLVVDADSAQTALRRSAGGGPGRAGRGGKPPAACGGQRVCLLPAAAACVAGLVRPPVMAHARR